MEKLKNWTSVLINPLAAASVLCVVAIISIQATAAAQKPLSRFVRVVGKGCPSLGIAVHSFTNGAISSPRRGYRSGERHCWISPGLIISIINIKKTDSHWERSTTVELSLSFSVHPNMAAERRRMINRIRRWNINVKKQWQWQLEVASSSFSCTCSSCQGKTRLLPPQRRMTRPLMDLVACFGTFVAIPLWRRFDFCRLQHRMPMI